MKKSWGGPGAQGPGAQISMHSTARLDTALALVTTNLGAWPGLGQCCYLRAGPPHPPHVCAEPPPLFC